jgi:hypothetical protein
MNILKTSGLIFLACAAYLLFDYLILPWVIAHPPQKIASPSAETPVRFTRPIKVETLPPVKTPLTQQNSRCDGRRHCSQMTSCAEAQFYLHHCPGTEMDGDHDGIPCENQFCGHHR